MAIPTVILYLLLSCLLVVRFVRQRESLRAATLPVATSGGGSGTLILLRSIYFALLAIALVGIAGSSYGLRPWIGLATVAAGVSLRISALRTIGPYYASTRLHYQGHHIVRKGPYSVLRHPLAMGLILELVGLSLMSATLLSAALVGAGVLTVQANNAREEAFLSRAAGHAYHEFARATWDLPNPFHTVWVTRTFSTIRKAPTPLNVLRGLGRLRKR